MADAESKGQAGGKRIYGEDMSKCQNHKLKKIYEAGVEQTIFYNVDFEAMNRLASTLCKEGNLNRDIMMNQVHLTYVRHLILSPSLTIIDRRSKVWLLLRCLCSTKPGGMDATVLSRGLWS